jgi:addiction module HigA family antidote
MNRPRPINRRPTTWQEILEQEFMIPYQIDSSVMATHLQLSEESFLAVYNSDDPITLDMATRLSKVFNTTEDLWLNLSATYQQWLMDAK